MKNRLAALSDVHILGSNPVGRKDVLTDVQWEKLDYVYTFARRVDADVAFAGDIFNGSNNYHLLKKASEFFSRYKNAGVTTYSVFGQHDMKYRNKEDTNLDILAASGVVNILGSVPVDCGHFRVYGASWNDPIPVPDQREIVNLLVIHAPISPSALFHGHGYTSISEFVEAHPMFDIIITGDVHRTFAEEYNGTVVLNSGPLLRKEADEYNMIHKPGFFFIDMNEITFTFQQVDHASAREVISRKHIEKKRVKEISAAIADTAHFLDELRTRTASGQFMNIRERIKDRIENSPASTGAKSVLEYLLGERDLNSWLQERLQNQGWA